MPEYPVRAGIFTAANDALELVNHLKEAGFTWDEVSVVCSDELKESLFPQQTQKLPTGSSDNDALNAAGVGALGLGGAAAVAAMLSTAGTAIMIVGAFAGVAALGTITSLLATRGFESEATDYYEQAVEEGNILVAVEVPGHGPDVEAKRKQAAKLIEESGAHAFPLAH